MATLLNRKDKNQLGDWVGRRCGFKLLFKATRDGCSASSFHNLCDNKGPTITVLYNKDDSVFGGYVNQSWNSSNNYLNDVNAFLFRLKFNGKLQPAKYPVSNAGYAMYCNPSYGPTFGGGHDLHSFGNTVTKSGGLFSLNGYYKYGRSYDMRGDNANTINNDHLVVKDIEVLQVTDTDDAHDDLLETPWRREPEWNNETMQDLKRFIETYKPVNDVKEVNMLLLGQVGAGKSSVFNSVNSVFRGEVSAKARSGTAEQSLTTKFRRYRIKDSTQEKYLNFRMCDTRGLEPEAGLQSHDIGYLLDGHVPEHYQFNPAAHISPTMLGFIKKPSVRDRIHAIIMVVDASTFDVMPEAVTEKFKDLQKVFNDRDLPQVIFLTKVDKLCQWVNEDLSNVFRSEAVLEVLGKVADSFGVPRGHVFPVKNYENETDTDVRLNILVLKALKQLLNFADEYIEDQGEELSEARIQE